MLAELFQQHFLPAKSNKCPHEMHDSHIWLHYEQNIKQAQYNNSSHSDMTLH